MTKEEVSAMINRILNEVVVAIEGEDASTAEAVLVKNQISKIFQRHIPKKPFWRIDGDKSTRFCPRCGEKVEHKAYCSNCGQAIAEWGEEQYG